MLVSLWDMKQGLFEKKPWFLSEPTITREWLVKIKFVERQRRPCDYHDMATARHYFIYEGFSPISSYFKLTGQLNSAHAEGHFL